MAYIFIHGLGQNSTSWDKTILHMTKELPLSCPDLFTSLQNKEATYKNLYCTFSNYCENASGPLHLCGLSLGAVLALNYAIDNPEKVKSLVMIGAQYKTPKALLKLQNIIFRLMPIASFKRLGFEKNAFIQLLHSMTDLNFSKEIKRISCITLVVCGEKDYANKRAARDIVRNLSKAEFQFIKDAGHEVNIEAPQKLAAILDAFYQQS